MFDKEMGEGGGRNFAFGSAHLFFTNFAIHRATFQCYLVMLMRCINGKRGDVHTINLSMSSGQKTAVRQDWDTMSFENQLLR